MTDSAARSSSIGIRGRLEPVVPLVLAGLAALFLWLPLDDMVVDGLFTWHLLQPQTLQGGGELVLLYVLVVACLLAGRRAPWLALGGVGLALALYLRRHHVDLPGVVAVFFLEVLLALGASVERALGLERRLDLGGYLQRFLTGTILWVGVCLTLSALGGGDPGELRRVAVVVGALSLAHARTAPLSWSLAKRLPSLGRFETLVAAFFVVLLACLLARTNVTVYHDSLWYSFRGDLVLAPEGGDFFRSLGLVSQVHYYPKLLEILTLPLSGLGDFSFILAFSVGTFAILALVLYLLGRRLGLERPAAMLGAALAGTLPAVANIPLTGKPDLLAAVMLSLCALYSWDFLRRREAEAAYLAVAAVLLSFAAKVTSLAYGGLLILGVGAVALGARRYQDARPAPADGPTAARWLAFGVCAGAAVVSAALYLRTYLLTGFPTVVPGQLAALWERLGFSLRYPVGVVIRERGESLSDLPALVHDFLFAPTRLPLARITWTGNGWLFFLLAALLFLAAGRRRSAIHWPALAWTPVMLAGIFFALMFNNAERGGDGNYYMFPLLLGSLLFFSTAFDLGRDRGRLLTACAVAFVLMQAGIGFLTAAWAPGTKTWDLDFSRSVFDTSELRENVLRQNGLAEIAIYLESLPGVPRVVGLGPEDVTRWLPARYESLRVISYARPSPVASVPGMLAYLRSQRIDFVLVPKIDRRSLDGRLARALADTPGAVVVEDRLYRLIDLRSVELDSAALASRLEEPDRRVAFDLAERLGEAELVGQEPLQAPWGTRIARADPPTELFTGSGSLVLAEDTAVRYTLSLPASRSLRFEAQVGLYPQFQVAGVSDGVLAVVEAAALEAPEAAVMAEVEIDPATGFLPLTLDLERFAGRRVKLALSVRNREGAQVLQDWVVWARPVVDALPSSPQR